MNNYLFYLSPLVFFTFPRWYVLPIQQSLGSSDEKIKRAKSGNDQIKRVQQRYIDSVMLEKT